MITVHDFGALLICGFFAVAFLQSGFDKAMDAKGNLEFLTAHFANSPMRKVTKMLFSLITWMEILTGLACVVGVAGFFYSPIRIASPICLLLSLLTLLCLFAGQRVAKDYPGAATLAAYVVVAIGGLLLLPNEVLIPPYG